MFELERAERLSALVYLDSLLLYKNTGPLGKVTAKMIKTEIEWPCYMNRGEWAEVLGAIQADAYLSALHVIETEDILTSSPKVRAGHRAVLFGDRLGRGYAVFRGTGSEEEWQDNAEGMTEADTIQQQAAARCVTRTRRKFRHMTLAGHSKGGNKAQYAAITLDEFYADSCFSIDGQAFSAAFCEKYKEAIEKRRPVIQLAAERRGFIHALGIQVAETRYFTGRRGIPREGRPHGDPLPKFHCPDALRDISGKLGPESLQNPIPAAISRLVKHFMETPKYSYQWDSTAQGLISMVIHKKRAAALPEESAAAVARMLLVFMELIASDVSFRKQVTETIFKETDVLLASMGLAKTATQNAVQKLANILVKDRVSRRNFIAASRYIISLRQQLTSDRQAKLSEYISELLRTALQILAEKLTALPVLRHVHKAWDDRRKNHLYQLLEEWEDVETEISFSSMVKL